MPASLAPIMEVLLGSSFEVFGPLVTLGLRKTMVQKSMCLKCGPFGPGYL